MIGLMQHSNFSTSGTCKYFCLIQEYRLLIITNTQKKKKENQQISFSRTVYWTAYLTTLIQLTKCYQCDQLVCVCFLTPAESPSCIIQRAERMGWEDGSHWICYT